jgi:hypothetical protein
LRTGVPSDLSAIALATAEALCEGGLLSHFTSKYIAIFLLKHD